MGCAGSSATKENKNNFIIGIVNVPEPIKDVDGEDFGPPCANIINSYENMRYDDKKGINEDEIKQAEIRINDKPIEFEYCPTFKAPGKYTIKITFNKPLTNAHSLFGQCDYESLDLSNFNSENVTTFESMFTHCTNLKEVNMDNLNTKNVTNIHSMFMGCENLDELDLTSFNVENVTDASGMFYGCENLRKLDCNFNFKKVKDLNTMFEGCKNLLYVDVFNWTTTNTLINIGYMFSGCEKLEHIDFSKFDCSKIVGMTGLFRSCTSLTRVEFPNNFNKNTIQDANDVFENCDALEEYNIVIDRDFYDFLKSKE
jgi:surface protein